MVVGTELGLLLGFFRPICFLKNDVDGQHNRVVRIGLCGGNKEVTGQELLAATHCNGIWPSSGWYLQFIKLKGTFFDMAAGSRPNFARMCG